MADGRWVMTETELNNVACGFDDGTKRRTLEGLPNYKQHKAVDNREGQAKQCCAFCGSENMESGFGGYGKGFGYKSSRCLDCGGTTDFVYEDTVGKYDFAEAPAEEVEPEEPQVKAVEPVAEDLEGQTTSPTTTATAQTSSYADVAETNFRKGYNCCQAVFVTFAEVAGLSEQEAAKMASPFGAGFGKLREVCGAVSGMTMLAGILEGYSDPTDSKGKKELYGLIQKMCGEFEEREGTLICRELLGLKKGEDLEEPAVRTEEYYQSRPCIRLCRTAAEIAEKYLIK